MTKNDKNLTLNFMGVKPASFDNARVIILPFPYEGTVTYGSGTQNAPNAIIEASSHVEFYDDELDFEPYALGIHTLPEMKTDFDSPDDMFQSIQEIGTKLAESGKLVIMLGGEHSITPGMVSAFAKIYDGVSVLQLDAHADLRDTYNGSRYNHACAMRRVLEHCPSVQVGIRSLSHAEKRFIDYKQLPVFFMRDMKHSDWMDDAIERLSENVYVTLDLDVFDPSIMPSVGTPEPDGMLWNDVTTFLRKLADRRKIIGFDVVELSPQEGNIAPDFLTAKLIYKMIGYTLLENRKQTESVNIQDKRGIDMANMTVKTYVLQLTDSATELTCAMKIDPELSTSYREVLDKYVNIINKEIMTPESEKNLSIIQDCIYKIDDKGELLDLYDGIIVKHGDDIVDLDDETTYEFVHPEDQNGFMLLDLAIDRSQITEEGNPYGYNIRQWKKNQDIFEKFVTDCITEKHGSEADRILQLDTQEDKKKFLLAISRKIWESDFELYSRFIGDKQRFKDPSETLKNIISGRGGTCTEKSSAMKMLTDVYGFESEYLLGGPGAKGPFPANALRKMLTTMDFSLGKKYMAYWQHASLLYSVDGEDVMIDVTNGNVPFLFLTGYDSVLPSLGGTRSVLPSLGGTRIEELLNPNNKKSVKVRMIMDNEEFYYHVIPQDIPENLITAMQDWIENVDLINVFDDGLGLLIREDYYVCPLMYHEDDDKLKQYDWWLEMKDQKKLPAVELLDNYSLPGTIVNEFEKKYPQKFADIVEAADYLAERYNESYRESADDPLYNVAYIFVKLK